MSWFPITRPASVSGQDSASTITRKANLFVLCFNSVSSMAPTPFSIADFRIQIKNRKLAIGNRKAPIANRKSDLQSAILNREIEGGPLVHRPLGQDAPAVALDDA